MRICIKRERNRREKGGRERTLELLRCWIANSKELHKREKIIVTQTRKTQEPGIGKLRLVQQTSGKHGRLFSNSNMPAVLPSP